MGDEAWPGAIGATSRLADGAWNGELEGRALGSGCVWRARPEAIGRVPRSVLAAWAPRLVGRDAAFVGYLESQRPPAGRQ